MCFCASSITCEGYQAPRISVVHNSKFTVSSYPPLIWCLPLLAMIIYEKWGSQLKHVILRHNTSTSHSFSSYVGHAPASEHAPLISQWSRVPSLPDAGSISAHGNDKSCPSVRIVWVRRCISILFETLKSQWNFIAFDARMYWCQAKSRRVDITSDPIGSSRLRCGVWNWPCRWFLPCPCCVLASASWRTRISTKDRQEWIRTLTTLACRSG